MSTGRKRDLTGYEYNPLYREDGDSAASVRLDKEMLRKAGRMVVRLTDPGEHKEFLDMLGITEGLTEKESDD